MGTAARLSDWEKQISMACALTHVRCYGSVESTMDAARDALAGLDKRDSALFLAREQTTGRGRQGRSWAQPISGFYGTYAFAASSGIATVAGFSLVAGIAVIRTLEGLGLRVKLKWPNDVLSETGAKVCGILIDIVNEHGVPWILTGIGINLSGEPRLDNDNASSSLETLGARNVTPVEIASRLSPILLDCWKLYCNQGFAAFRAEWLASAYAIERAIAVDTGSETVQGVFIGVSDRGGLLVQRDAQTTEIISGHVIKI